MAERIRISVMLIGRYEETEESSETALITTAQKFLLKRNGSKQEVLISSFILIERRPKQGLSWCIAMSMATSYYRIAKYNYSMSQTPMYQRTQKSLHNTGFYYLLEIESYSISCNTSILVNSVIISLFANGISWIDSKYGDLINDLVINSKGLNFNAIAI